VTRAALVFFLVLSGCLPNPTREAQRYFVLDAPEPKGGSARVPRAAVLVVPPTATASFYDTQDIVYSRAPGTRAYYQFNSWTERPGRALHELLVSRLERSGAFRKVATSGAGSDGLVLRTRLEELYHDAANAPGSARIVLAAELLDPARGEIARRTFSQSAPAPSYDAPGAVQAFRQGLGALLDEVIAWLDEHAPRSTK
jgi:cholesterol transport system auxiliary component